MFNTVVVGADDSSTARQAVVVAADIAKLTGGTLHIVTAYQRKSVRVQDLPEEFRHSADHQSGGCAAPRICPSSRRSVDWSR